VDLGTHIVRVTLVRAPGLDRAGRQAIGAADLGALLRRCGEALGVPKRAGLAVRLTDDVELRQLNADFSGVEEATDVLAFPGDEPGHVGDLAISVERALGQPDGVAELRLLAVHGLLHCLGYEHGDRAGAAAMSGMTRQLLPDQSVPELEPGAVEAG
jgi:probable rRNA maturation factor